MFQKVFYLSCQVSFRVTYHQSASDGRSISVHKATEARSPAPRRLITRFFHHRWRENSKTLDKKELTTNRWRSTTNFQCALHSEQFRTELRRQTERGFERGRSLFRACTSLDVNKYRHASVARKLCMATRVFPAYSLNLQGFFMEVHSLYFTSVVWMGTIYLMLGRNYTILTEWISLISLIRIIIPAVILSCRMFFGQNFFFNVISRDFYLTCFIDSIFRSYDCHVFQCYDLCKIKSVYEI